MHDLRYKNLGLNGGLSLVFDVRGLGADMAFVNDHMNIASDSRNDIATRAGAVVIGLGLGFLASFKNAALFVALTANQLDTMSPLPKISYTTAVKLFFYESNYDYGTEKKVDSKPIQHIHDPINKPLPKR
ncbi:MAG: hypothetical protein IPK11_00900 [Ignavibacteria bacterium]|nr:hypothetical protein [Ignavibacteria bacterium]